ncbi:hypothetical protein ACFLVS_01390 [Chloroflexota bacterium]
MSKLPKLRVKLLVGHSNEEVRDFEQTQYFLFSYGANTVVMVEGRIVNSYEELVQLAAQGYYKDKESLEVQLLPAVIGGG